jgi:hypothetical protein
MKTSLAYHQLAYTDPTQKIPQNEIICGPGQIKPIPKKKSGSKTYRSH